MNNVPKTNGYSQATLVPIPLSQTVGGAYGYTSVPVAAYQQQIMQQQQLMQQQQQQLWSAKPAPFGTATPVTAQHPSGGLVCMLPDNVACMAMDVNNHATPLNPSNSSPCVYNIYYGAGGSNVSAGGWSTVEAANVPQQYYVQHPMPMRVADTPQQRATPQQYSQQPMTAQFSYMPQAVNVQGSSTMSPIIYSPAASNSTTHASRVQTNAVCRHYLAGRCNRRNCRFLHVGDSGASTS